MTEAEQILQELRKRLTPMGHYGIGEIAGSPPCMVLSLTDATVLICVDDDPETGRAKMALTYLTMKDQKYSVHLNQWNRPEKTLPIGALVESLWRSFWIQEKENESLSRILWMHGADLPKVVKKQSFLEGSALELFFERMGSV